MIPNELVILEAAVLIGLQVRDYKTTLDGFKHGASEEAAATKGFIEKLGLKNGVALAKLLAIVVVLGMVVIQLRQPSPWMPYALGAAIAYYAWVIVNNIRVKQKLKKT